jgi:hypothetical protein
MSNYNDLKIIHKISDQQNRKAHQATTENDHTGQCARTSVSINVKVQNVCDGEKTLYEPQIVTTE